MAKTQTGKRVVFEVEFYWHGKRRKPSVDMIFESDTYEGLPKTIEESPEFIAFDKASRELCRVLTEAGELD